MQYYYESELYYVTAELTEVTNLVLSTPRPEIDNILDTDVHDMCLFSDNHAYLSQLVSEDAVQNWRLQWCHISARTTNMKLLRNHIHLIDWSELSSNPNALELLQENIDKINWINLARNPGAIPIIQKYWKNISVCELCANPNAVHLLDKCDPHELNFNILAENPNAFRLIKKHLKYIVKNKVHSIWRVVAEQPTEEAATFIIDNMWDTDTINGVKSMCFDEMGEISGYIWSSLSENPYAVDFLEKHQTRINWSRLCINPNPKAMMLLAERVKIDPMVISSTTVSSSTAFRGLATNPNAEVLVLQSLRNKLTADRLTYIAGTRSNWAMDFIEYILDHTPIERLGSSWIPTHGHGWYLLSQNPMAHSIQRKYASYLHRSGYLSSNQVTDNTYVYIYEKMRYLKHHINSDILACVHHPKNVHTLYRLGFDEFKMYDPAYVEEEEEPKDIY